MKFLFALLFAFTLSFTANAGFEGKQAGKSLNVFQGINCAQGMTCTRTKGGIFNMVASAAQSPLSLASARTLTAAECGSTFYNAGAIQLVLPDAATILGCKYTFVTLNASNFDVDPNAADIILVQTDAVGDRIRNATLGNSITIQAVSASQWAVVGILGTWADAN